MRVELEMAVTLKEGLLDPQGTTVLEALPAMGWDNVADVRIGKLVRMTIEAADETAARAQAEDIGRRLLANPVIEDVRVLDAHEVVA